jgi:hypothetical protein
MTPTRPPAAVPMPRRPGRAVAVLAAAVLAATVAACGGTPSGSTSTTSVPVTADAVVKPPKLTMEGCNYEIGGTVPSGMAQGSQPPFTLSGQDQAGTAALAHIAAHGGTGVVSGFTLPAGTKLYAGPDASVAPVATVATGDSMLLAEPVLWTTGSGAHWLATFVACGGEGLYWVDVSQIGQADHDAGVAVTNALATAMGDAPYTTSGMPSTLPIVIEGQQFAWKDRAVVFPIGRAEYQNF